MLSLRWRLAAPGFALALGCAGLDSRMAMLPDAPVVARGQSGEHRPPLLNPEELTARRENPPPGSEPIPAPINPPSAKSPVLPISLDDVMRLAEQQNPTLAVAREKVCQAFAEQEVADKRWLPDIHIGGGYYRHEGGIQDQDGRLVRSSAGAAIGGVDLDAKLDLRAASFAKIDAARRTWQQKGELRKVTSEVLLDAAGAYIDLLAAHNGLAIIRSLDGDLRGLQQRAQKLANLEKGARVEVVRIDAEITGQEQLVRKLEGQARAASAKLAYLLGLDPCTELVPVDTQLVPLCLANADASCCELVAQAVACGPGMRELEAILCVIHQGMREAAGPMRFMPVFTAQALEGGFGAGRNDDLTFTNRFDFAVQARWNLTDFCKADAKRRISNSAVNQAHFTYADLKGKLTLGVQEARETILSGRDQIRLAEEQIKFAQTAMELSDVRLREGIQGSSFSEVLMSQRAVAAARANYLQVLREYDKAQLRLMVLTGCSGK